MRLDAPRSAPTVPFLKWRGGKRRIAPFVRSILPPTYRRYIEPFLGGGGLFFGLADVLEVSSRPFLSDLNPYLIHAFTAVRDCPAELIPLLLTHECFHNPRYFQRVRSEFGSAAPFNEIGPTAAADFIYLVNTSFNGAWRVNAEGRFTGAVTGKPSPWKVRPMSLMQASAALRQVDLGAQDFRVTLDGVQPEDLVFVDPPYLTSNEEGDPSGYTAARFNQADQRELLERLVDLGRQGSFVVITQPDGFHTLDKLFGFRFAPIRASRQINECIGWNW